MFAKKQKKVKSRNVMHDDWKLRKASDYLELDLHSFAAGIDIFRKARGTELGNAALDSLLVRGRVLIDFLFQSSGKPDDVLAIDYFYDFNPKPYKPYMTKAVEKERDKINKRLMHLTTKPMPRLRSNQRYSVANIAKPIVKAFRKWLELVPDSLLQRPPKQSRATFENHINRIESMLF